MYNCCLPFPVPGCALAKIFATMLHSMLIIAQSRLESPFASKKENTWHAMQEFAKSSNSGRMPPKNRSLTPPLADRFRNFLTHDV